MTTVANTAKRALRNAYGKFATGIAVVTTTGDSGEPVGLTINSFSSVSLEPPLVLWSLRMDSSCLDLFQRTDRFAINVLADDQKGVCERFARSVPDKFAGIPYKISKLGIPLIDGAIAQFECTKQFEYGGGDHVIFVGEVIHFDTADRPPLIFHAGNYATASTPYAVA